MKYVILVSRLLLGLVFTAFGAISILHFKGGSLPPGDAATWSELMAAHHYTTFVGVLQLVAGILLLVGRFVPLGLTILAPILVNILAFHILFMPQGVIYGLICSVLEIILLIAYHRNFAPLFAPNPEADTSKL
jgi:putative oxidoreductase